MGSRKELQTVRPQECLPPLAHAIADIILCPFLFSIKPSLCCPLLMFQVLPATTRNRNVFFGGFLFTDAPLIVRGESSNAPLCTAV